MRVLLIQPPFWAINSPSIGLSYLKAALEDAGFEADILYANLEFADLVSEQDYELVQSRLPVDLLFGELVFSPAFNRVPVQPESVAQLIREYSSRRSIPPDLPDDLVDRYSEMAERALVFIERFRQRAPWKGYDLVGFTTTFSLVPALAMARAMKEEADAPLVMFGGGHCEGSLGEAVMEHFPWIDFVARGDGEALIVGVARHLQGLAVDLSAIDGLLWRSDGTVQSAACTRAKAQDLDQLPMPRYTDWLEAWHSHGYNDPSRMRLPMETSRGCWYGQKQPCTFCGLNGEGLAYRSKGADRVLEEYQCLMEHGTKVIYAVDSILNHAFFRDVIPRITALPEKAVMFYEVRPTLSKKQLMALRDAGIRVLQPGIESLNTRLLGLMGKGTTAFQVIRFMKWAQESCIPISWNLLCDIWGENIESYKEMLLVIDMIQHMMPPSGGLNLVHIDRFSRLFQSKKDLVPVSSYFYIYPDRGNYLSELAYFFEGRLVEESDLKSALLVDLLNAVSSWRKGVGRAAFYSIDDGDIIHVVDCRFSEVPVYTRLEGVGALILRSTRNGISLNDIDGSELWRSEGVKALISMMIMKKWLIDIDGYLLGLNVSIEVDEMPSAVGDAFMSELTDVVRDNMLQLWRVVNGV